MEGIDEVMFWQHGKRAALSGRLSRAHRLSHVKQVAAAVQELYDVGSRETSEEGAGNKDNNGRQTGIRWAASGGERGQRRPRVGQASAGADKAQRWAGA